MTPRSMPAINGTRMISPISLRTLLITPANRLREPAMKSGYVRIKLALQLN